MTQGYFHRVARETPTRFWINLPSAQEMELAIAAGAVSCTTNPTYCARLIGVEPSHMSRVIDRVVDETEEDEAAIDRIHQEIVSRAVDRFAPLHEASAGADGHVLVQGDPRFDDDVDRVVRDALRYRSLGPNVVVKIPGSLPAMRAIETLVPRGVPLCVTGVFAVAQAVYACELYQKAATGSGQYPPFYVTHVTGIFDQYLAQAVERDPVDLAPEILGRAGCAVAREQYRILRQRGDDATMLGGGAVRTDHFSEMVGGALCVTIGWSIAEALIQADGPVVPRFGVQLPPSGLDELSDKVPDFRRAFYEDALAPAEFGDYGPFVLFRNNFLTGYARLQAEIAAHRARRSAPLRHAQRPRVAE